jgi:phosphate transport system permease protein/phosphate transport system substrate-binding protein
MYKRIVKPMLLGFISAILLASVIEVTMSVKSYAQLLPKQLQSQSGQVTINGAGSTFVFPLMDNWRVAYQKVKPDVSINYQSIGSGGGVKQFTAKTVDFGASDAPLSEQEQQAAKGAVHIPITIGSVVAAYNIPSVPNKGLKLTGPILADIFLGKITKWNDPKIQTMNPGVSLPSNNNIVVVHRSDGSGTTFVWTDYLSKVSSEWSSRVGKAKSVPWPTGIGAPGNEGVANAIRGTPNTIGYVELAYSLTTKMPYAFIQNKAGKFIEPSLESTKAAVSASAPQLPKGDGSWSSISMVNAPGDTSYPIASFVYILVYMELSTDPGIDQAKAKALTDFFLWAVTDGQKLAPSLDYVPLPDQVVKLDQDTLKSLTFHGKPLI